MQTKILYNTIIIYKSTFITPHCVLLLYSFLFIMGNANGKFDATTVALYNRLDLIQQRTYESKKTAAKVMTNRSAKALHLAIFL